MKKKNGGQRFDDDILRCKEEILRLKSVVPSFGRPPKRTSGPPAVVRQEPEPVIERAPLSVIETTQPVIDVPSEPIEAAAESMEQTAVQTMVEEATLQPTIQEAAFEPEPAPESEVESEPLVEDSNILAALEAEAAKTNPAPTPESEPEFESEPQPEPESEEPHGQTSGPSHTESEPDDESKIPEFNLAEQIMAAQRKVVGNRRKGPGNAKEADQETPTTSTADIQPPVAPVPPPPPPPAAPIRIVAMEAPMSPQQKVIADIVARDINKFYQTRKVS